MKQVEVSRESLEELTVTWAVKLMPFLREYRACDGAQENIRIIIERFQTQIHNMLKCLSDNNKLLTSKEINL